MYLINLNENSIVTAYSKGDGYIEGYVEADTIPTDFAPYKYSYIDGTYVVNEEYDDGLLTAAKEQAIAGSKEALAVWLADNPMLYNDGKCYSVTEEKQSLLNSNLASYERAKNASATYPLKWNASGEECTEWTYEELVALSLAIAAYVAPKVAAQQALEIAIKACTTAEELAEVVIDYDNA